MRGSVECENRRYNDGVKGVRGLWPWLTVGLGIKRWLVLLAFGALVLAFGLTGLLARVPGRYPSTWPAAWSLALLAIGGALMLQAVIRLGRNLTEPLVHGEGTVVDSLVDYRLRDRGPRIVAIGGGTGLPALLRGLTPYTSNLTAIVTVADDGGSSGRLRRELGMLPPGDFRNNLAALARDEALMTQLLQYRFGGPVESSSLETNGGLQGHAFGNLLLAALTGITGSFDEALPAAQRVLALRGRVLPATLTPVTLAADVCTDDEAEPRRVVGESAISATGGRIERLGLEPPDAPAFPPSLQAIFQADLIVIGPGSLYTSILPNLLVTDLAEALRHARARTVYVCNLATQPGETEGYSVAAHVDAIRRHVPGDFLDIVLANNNLTVPPETGGGDTHYVRPEPPDGVMMIATDLVDEARPWRHDSAKLGRAILGLLER